MGKGARKSSSLGIAQSLVLAMLLSVGSALFLPSAEAAPPVISYNNQVCDLTSGSGTLASPYLISSADQLWEATDCTRVGGSPSYLELANNIDVSVATNAPTNSPIGFSSSSVIYTFSGTLDGKGYEISGIAMSRTDGVGLFAYLSGATLKNFSLAGSFTTSATANSDNNSAGALAIRSTNSVTIDAVTNSASVRGGWRVGGLIGFHGRTGLSDAVATLQILNSVNQGLVRASGNHLGGLVGLSEETIVISNSGNVGSVASTGTSNNVGGLIGNKSQQSTTITNAYNRGTVSGAAYVGGLIGNQDSPTTITNTYNSGSISGTKQVGGLVGSGYRINIVKSFNTGQVSAGSTLTFGSAGGLLGELTTNGSNYHISQSFNTGNVSGYEYVGGLLGVDNSDGGTLTFIDSYNSGQVSGSLRIGGIAGNSRAANNLTRTYNSGTISGTSIVDGLVGENSPTVSTSYTLTTSRLVSSSSIADLRQASTYVGWNFSSIWGFGECTQRDGLPLLRFAQELTTFYSSGCLDSTPQPHVSDRTWDNWYSSSPYLVLAFSASPGVAFSVQIPISGVSAGGSVELQDAEFYRIATAPITLTNNITINLDASSVSTSTIHIQISGSNVATTLGTNPNPDSWNQQLKGILSWGNIGLTNISKAIFGATVTQVPNSIPAAVTDLSEFFWGQPVFNQDISGWNVSNVTQMPGMFRQASAFNQNISSWNVSSVINMAYMFVSADQFNQPIGNWNVSNVTNFNLMFYNNPIFNQPLANWDVTNGQDMSFMFENATSFNQNISNWTVSNAINMNSMFKGATSFDQKLNWKPTAADNLQDIFHNSAMSCVNYDHFLNSIAGELPTVVSKTLGGGRYTENSEVARSQIDTKGWTLSHSPCVTNPRLSAVTFSATAGSSVTFAQSYSGGVSSFSIAPALPSGLTLSQTNGEITGVLSSPFSGEFTITATNRDGTSSASISIRINPAPTSGSSADTPPKLVNHRIPKFENLHRLPALANTVSSILMRGTDLNLIERIRLDGVTLEFERLNSQEIILRTPPTPVGTYELRFDLTEGVLFVGSALEFYLPASTTLSSSQLLVQANRFSSWLPSASLERVRNWIPMTSQVVCLAYNDRPGLAARKKALSRASQACGVLGPHFKTRIFVYGKAGSLANTVKLISR